MTDLLAAVSAETLAALLVSGIISAFIPVVSAEAILGAAVVVSTTPWWWLALTMGVAQTIGKIIIFLGSRHGARWLREWRLARGHLPRPRPPGSVRARLTSWSQRLLALMDRPLGAWGVVGVSSLVGIPPLAVTSVVAGTRRMPLTVFTVACLVGRVARFAAVAYPVAALDH